MTKRLLLIITFFIFASVASYSQWTFQGPWPDDTYKGGTHGIEVAPDGKIWTASYYRENWVTPDNDTVSTSPIYVFNPDGSLLQKIYTVTTGSDIDTLGKGGGTSGTRSLAKDPDGNIYFSSAVPAKAIKINYQTFEGMARGNVAEVAQSPIVGGVSTEGIVFVGPVVGGGSTAIAMYDAADFSYIGNAIVAPPSIARYFTISEDGNTIYWTPFTNTHGLRIYSRPDAFSDYALVDSALAGMSVETARINPATGLLWVSNDSRGANKEYTHLTWYGYDLEAKAIVDSFTLPSPDPEPSDEYPRGLAFSADGNTAYVGLFGSKYNRIYKFTKEAVSVERDDNVIVDNYSLSQNYPNPFNPVTQIKFSIVNEGLVTLKIYDMLGREVAELINQNMTNGTYTVDFDGSNLSSGNYIYRLQSGNVQLTNKMMLLK